MTKNPHKNRRDTQMQELVEQSRFQLNHSNNHHPSATTPPFTPKVSKYDDAMTFNTNNVVPVAIIEEWMRKKNEFFKRSLALRSQQQQQNEDEHQLRKPHSPSGEEDTDGDNERASFGSTTSTPMSRRSRQSRRPLDISTLPSVGKLMR